jgi:nucleotidyltransferase substrate binding protein (TIGR01987 family)
MNYEKFQKSLRHLQWQRENLANAASRPELTELDREAVAESVVQRFETCYDTIWKDLKQYLLGELGLPDVPNSPKPSFKLAAQNGLLPSPVEHWLEYANSRVATAHDYSGTKAAEVVENSEQFISDAIALFQKLSGEPWTRS